MIGVIKDDMQWCVRRYIVLSQVTNSPSKSFGRAQEGVRRSLMGKVFIMNTIFLISKMEMGDSDIVKVSRSMVVALVVMPHASNETS